MTHKILDHKKILVIGILNATPDSFSDGGEIENKKNLSAKVATMISEGANIIDIGGESTRPGHKTIDQDTEISRVLPVIREVRRQSKTIPISIDTQKAKVARTALENGANIINDISALGDPKMADVATDFNCPIILMRSRPLSDDLIESCEGEFQAIIKNAQAQGIEQKNIILDPGLGFGDLKKQDYQALPGGNAQANLELIKNVNKYSLGFPVLIGASRKRFVGEIMNQPDPKKRTAGSVDLAVLAVRAGAKIVRVHDVKETIAALKLAGLLA